jgi:Ca2+-binding EF-hand superfamily protein
MSATWGVGLDTTVSKLNLEIRFRLTQRFGHKGLRKLYQIIKGCDLDNSGDLSKEEFESALNHIGLFFAKHQATALFLYYDQNCDGRIGYNEFLNSFR